MAQYWRIDRLNGKLEEAAERILAELKPKSFPDDYIPEDEKTTDFTIPKCQDVMMYRELEGVFVFLDGERIFFKDPYEAKYMFYCAKRGVTNVKMPHPKTLKRVLKEFHAYLENLRYEVEKECIKLNFADQEKDDIIRICAEKLGYDLIADI